MKLTVTMILRLRTQVLFPPQNVVSRLAVDNPFRLGGREQNGEKKKNCHESRTLPNLMLAGSVLIS